MSGADCVSVHVCVYVKMFVFLSYLAYPRHSTVVGSRYPLCYSGRPPHEIHDSVDVFVPNGIHTPSSYDDGGGECETHQEERDYVVFLFLGKF